VVSLLRFDDLLSSGTKSGYKIEGAAYDRAEGVNLFLSDELSLGGVVLVEVTKNIS